MLRGVFTNVIVYPRYIDINMLKILFFFFFAKTKQFIKQKEHKHPSYTLPTQQGGESHNYNIKENYYGKQILPACEQHHLLPS